MKIEKGKKKVDDLNFDTGDKDKNITKRIFKVYV